MGSYHYNKENGSVSGKWGPLSAILNASYNATEGYRENGFLRAKDVGGKLIYELNENISFNFSGSFHQDDAGLPGGLTQADIYELDRRATLTPDDQAKTEDGYGAFGVKGQTVGFGPNRNGSFLPASGSGRFLIFRHLSPYQDERNLTTWGLTPRYILEKPLWNHSPIN